VFADRAAVHNVLWEEKPQIAQEAEGGVAECSLVTAVQCVLALLVVVMTCTKIQQKHGKSAFVVLQSAQTWLQ
jgi:hypothetical protein